jgi:hypothetical protein
MKKILIWILVISVIVFILLTIKYKIDITKIRNDKPMAILPPSFTMKIFGDFSDTTMVDKYEGGKASIALLMSSGGDELEGEVQYTYSKDDGYLILCVIKNKKWVMNGDLNNLCQSLSKLPTTRTELIRQIVNGDLKPIKSNICRDYELCYGFK